MPILTPLRPVRRRQAFVGSPPSQLMTPVSASDSGAGADAASLAAVVSAADAVSATDAGALDAALSATDTGAGADTASLVASLSAADAGAAVESTVLLAALSATDTGAGADTASLVASLSAADAGAAVESTVLLAALSATGTGAGVEFATPLPPLPVTFYVAMAAWYARDSIALIVLPGGLVDGEAAPHQVFPYGRYWGMEDQEPVSLEDEEIEVAVSVYALDDNTGVSGDELARAAGNAFKDRLLDPEARGEWLFAHNGGIWRESGCEWIPPGKLQTVGKAQGGNRVWRYDLWFKFFLTEVGS